MMTTQKQLDLAKRAKVATLKAEIAAMEVTHGERRALAAITRGVVKAEAMLKLNEEERPILEKRRDLAREIEAAVAPPLPTI